MNNITDLLPLTVLLQISLKKKKKKTCHCMIQLGCWNIEKTIVKEHGRGL